MADHSGSGVKTGRSGMEAISGMDGGCQKTREVTTCSTDNDPDIEVKIGKSEPAENGDTDSASIPLVTIDLGGAKNKKKNDRCGVYDKHLTCQEAGIYQEIKDYSVLKDLGEGTDGVVVLVKDNKTQEKFVRKSYKKENAMKKERTALLSLKGRNISPELYAYMDFKDVFYNFMEYINGMPLNDFLRALRRKKHKKSRAIEQLISSELVKTVLKLYDTRWTHNDLHGSNIILRMMKERLKITLIDFTKAKEFEQPNFDNFQKDFLCVLICLIYIFSGVEVPLENFKTEWKRDLQDASKKVEPWLFTFIEKALTINSIREMSKLPGQLKQLKLDGFQDLADGSQVRPAHPAATDQAHIHPNVSRHEITDQNTTQPCATIYVTKNNMSECPTTSCLPRQLPRPCSLPWPKLPGQQFPGNIFDPLNRQALGAEGKKYLDVSDPEPHTNDDKYLDIHSDGKGTSVNIATPDSPVSPSMMAIFNEIFHEHTLKELSTDSQELSWEMKAELPGEKKIKVFPEIVKEQPDPLDRPPLAVEGQNHVDELKPHNMAVSGKFQHLTAGAQINPAHLSAIAQDNMHLNVRVPEITSQNTTQPCVTMLVHVLECPTAANMPLHLPSPCSLPQPMLPVQQKDFTPESPVGIQAMDPEDLSLEIKFGNSMSK